MADKAARVDEKPNRATEFASALGFTIVGLFFAFALLYLYAFSSMVPPELSPSERMTAILHSFFVGRDFHHPFIVMGLIIACLMCSYLAILSLWSGMTNHVVAIDTSQLLVRSLLVTLVCGGMIYLLFQ